MLIDYVDDHNGNLIQFVNLPPEVRSDEGKIKQIEKWTKEFDGLSPEEKKKYEMKVEERKRVEKERQENVKSKDKNGGQEKTTEEKPKSTN